MLRRVTAVMIPLNIKVLISPPDRETGRKKLNLNFRDPI